MDAEFAAPALMNDMQGEDLDLALGGMDTCRKLVLTFYAHVAHDPVLDLSIRPISPNRDVRLKH